MPLLAVGPPLLTLVNFEVENLAYMLVCMQWMVSRGPASSPGHTAVVAEGGVSGTAQSTIVNRCACSDVEHMCSRAGGVSVCMCGCQVRVWCAFLTVRDEGGTLWAPSARYLSFAQGFLHPTSLHNIHGQSCEAGRARTYPLTWLRNSGPEKGW